MINPSKIRRISLETERNKTGDSGAQEGLEKSAYPFDVKEFIEVRVFILPPKLPPSDMY